MVAGRSVGRPLQFFPTAFPYFPYSNIYVRTTLVTPTYLLLHDRKRGLVAGLFNLVAVQRRGERLLRLLRHRLG